MFPQKTKRPCLIPLRGTRHGQPISNSAGRPGWLPVSGVPPTRETRIKLETPTASDEAVGVFFVRIWYLAVLHCFPSWDFLDSCAPSGAPCFLMLV